MQESSPRERRHTKTRDAILDAARAIIHESGMGGLSMREIARRIDYSAAGLYDYFGSKEEIVAALCDEGFRRLTIHLRAVDPTLPPLEALFQKGLRYHEFAVHSPDFFMLMFTSGPLAGSFDHPDGLPLEAVLRQSPAFMELYAAVERCEQAGDLPDTGEATTFPRALMLWQMIHGLSMLAITAGRSFPEHAASVAPALRTLARGMQAPAAQP